MKYPLSTLLAFVIGFGGVAAYNTQAEAAVLPVCKTGARILCKGKLPVPTRPAMKPYKAPAHVAR